MRPSYERLIGPAIDLISTFVGVSIDLPTFAEMSPVYRAVASVALVLLFGAAVLFRSRQLVEQSMETSMARPHVSLIYGLIGFGLVAFLGFLVLMQLSVTGITNQSISYVVAGLDGIAILGLAGLGYTVVGTRLFELVGGHQPWNGLGLGAALSGVIWVLLPPLSGGLVWVGVAALGIGGPVREWIHAERTVGSESGA